MEEGYVVLEIAGVVEGQVTEFTCNNRALYVNSFNVLLEIILTPSFIFASQTLVHDDQLEVMTTAVQSFNVDQEFIRIFTHIVTNMTFKCTRQAIMNVP